jgi:hypothetical protein
MKYKVYTLEDPENNVVRYIGITKQSLASRKAKHINNTKYYKVRNHKINWIKGLLKNNKKPLIQELDIASTYEELKYLEKYWIAQFKTWGFKLVNATEGGEGTMGYKHTKEALDKMKEIHSKKRKEKKAKMTRKEQNDYLSSLYSIEIVQYDANGKFVKTWKSCKEASIFYGVGSSTIGHALKNPERKSLNFFWRYSKNVNPMSIKVVSKVGNRYSVHVINHTDKTEKTFLCLEDCQKVLNISYPTLKKYIKNKKVYMNQYSFKKA